MIRQGLKLMDNALSYSYANNTLVIQVSLWSYLSLFTHFKQQYEKPQPILALELRAQEALTKCKKDGDVECNQQ